MEENQAQDQPLENVPPQEPAMKKERSKMLDKVIMGAVIGGAIGSVLGATLAPKKGKETRQDIVDIAVSAKDNTKSLYKRFKKFFGLGKKNEADSHKKIPNEMEHK